jgi:chromosome segregation ATPase
MTLAQLVAGASGLSRCVLARLPERQHSIVQEHSLQLLASALRHWSCLTARWRACFAAGRSWNQETAAARQEVARTHKALKDIQSNIDKVQSSVAAEDAALKAAAEAAQLEQQLEQQVQELLRGLQLRQGLLEQELQDRQQEEQRLEVSRSAASKLPAVAFALPQAHALPTPVSTSQK